MKTPIFFINTIKYNNKKNIKSKNLYSPKKIKLKIKQFLYQDTKSN